MTLEPAQLLTLILGSSVVGGISLRLFDVIRDWAAGHLKKRRAEVDRAIHERDQARKERDTALADLATARHELRWWDRWANVLEEALRLVRRRFIEAPCTDPDDLDPYPSRPDKEKP